MKSFSGKLFVAVLIFIFQSAAAAPGIQTSRASLHEAAPDPSLKVVRYTFRQLAGKTTYDIRTAGGSQNFTFGSRTDQEVQRMVLHLRYTFSPSLLPVTSHLRLLFNDQLVGVIPVTRENAGRLLTQDIELDPRLVADYNILTLETVSHYTIEACEDPTNNTLWVNVDGNSNLELTLKPLALPNDLTPFPKPFFEDRDYQALNLPFVFAAHPSRATLQSAGVAASWFGALADWRGARFPAYLDELPKANAIVLALNDQRPGFLSQHPPVQAPTIEIMTNPADDRSKLLLILGRNDEDLHQAMIALTLGHPVLSGSSMQITQVKEEVPRQAYDAPRWLRLDRAVRFGELVPRPEDLQVLGHVPSPIKISLRIPPDLFAWRSRGIPVDMRFRYTPPIYATESRLVMTMNGELVEAFNLVGSGEGGEHRVRLPLIDSVLFGSGDQVFIPPYKLWARDELAYAFSFAYQKAGFCKDQQVENVRAMIDSDSTIDMSGFPHYAEMPNLNHFSSLGFPFTKYADLQQTAVVLPEQADPYDIETYLSVMGHFGEATGYPATRFKLVGPGNTDALQDMDVLVIGNALFQGALRNWSEKIPVVVNDRERRISQARRSSSLIIDWLGFGTKPDARVANQERLLGTGPLAALVGFESPLSPKRSVLAITASSPQNLRLALDALDKQTMTQEIRGSASLIHPERIDSLLVGDTYFIGHLPFWLAIWYPLSGHPALLAGFGILSVLIFAFALWRYLRSVAARRLERFKEGKGK